MRLAYLIILIIIPLIGLYILADRYFIWEGEITYQTDFQDKKAVLSRLLPEGRVQIQENRVRILQEPVYVDVRMREKFKNASVDMAFSPENTPNIIKLGPQIGPDFQYDLKPVYSRTLEETLVNPEWGNIQEDGEILFFRKKSDNANINITDFKKNLPDQNKLAVFNIKLENPFKIEAYRAEKDIKKTSLELRGSHEIEFYAKNEMVSITFDYQDINRLEGEDPVNLLLFKGSNLLSNQQSEDDGISSVINKASPIKTVSLERFFEEGIYTLKISTTEDIIIRNIKTNLSRWGIKSRIYLANNSEYKNLLPDLNLSATQLWTNGKFFRARTTHASGIQEVQIHNQTFPISQTHQFLSHEYLGKDDWIPITIPKNDLYLETNGLYFFDPLVAFNPNPLEINEFVETIPDSVDYILAKYTPAQRTNESTWHLNAEFAVKNAWVQDQKLRFLFSIPRIEEQKAAFGISNFKIRLSQ
ncbi:MAG: hypothetical protein G01um101418_148 [Parcubacteria group bacterium Gr01-1014_18]|nr:MAG: hypothetical protein Greene041636_453 [Parcubacteria group bacterium Greene0416_36]TSC81475.1 MAG: hypothetical protein G01um101418_148 [Parcubacteria group bacterium Gr01-1014_18]TSC99073.1 MAG: hypothetical protein Greene101420_429 [Parcubacteria group bacterium Greene1014_20]TSD07246.1 MAG: hypothetical protein Greene07142_262 [Parcubacteria group bacterium Greene0714_2]